jgi:Holliday junction resolvase RusA-like endonuclease
MAATEIYIPRWHPVTVNQLLRGKWTAHRLKKADREMVWAYAQGHPKATGKRRVVLTIILKPGQRGADPDAFFKSLADALVQAGLLTDDNRQGVELAPVAYERGTATDWGTRIRLTDLSPP